ncbi:MAG: poly-gamma-glutamate synthase PgsB [candidate division WOR-3 bacterium]
MILLLVLGFISYGLAEYWLHLKNLRQIPIRIQVNGTRGKSSVTRLIAAGLRAGGLRVVAKVTGTRPRFIVGDNEEYPVRRLGGANIAEELRIVRLARRHNAQALVIECMALVPQYQWIENHLLIRPTHGVVTNVRADHLDVMGPTVKDVAQSLANTVPSKGHFFTAEQGSYQGILRTRAGPNVTFTVATPETVSDSEMAGFSYIEHKDNVALALCVCESLGVPRRKALEGMQRSQPDFGVMRIYQISESDRQLEVVYTMAANDPDSIRMLWDMVAARCPTRLVLVNCRKDRADRSRQLAELVATFPCDAIIATGALTPVFLSHARLQGIPAEKLIDLGEELEPSLVFQEVMKLVKERTLLFATGNTVGYGERLISYFASRATAQVGYQELVALS